MPEMRARCLVHAYKYYASKAIMRASCLLVDCFLLQGLCVLLLNRLVSPTYIFPLSYLHVKGVWAVQHRTPAQRDHVGLKYRP